MLLIAFLDVEGRLNTLIRRDQENFDWYRYEASYPTNTHAYAVLSSESASGLLQGEIFVKIATVVAEWGGCENPLHPIVPIADVTTRDYRLLLDSLPIPNEPPKDVFYA